MASITQESYDSGITSTLGGLPTWLDGDDYSFDIHQFENNTKTIKLKDIIKQEKETKNKDVLEAEKRVKNINFLKIIPNLGYEKLKTSDILKNIRILEEIYDLDRDIFYSISNKKNIYELERYILKDLIIENLREIIDIYSEKKKLPDEFKNLINNKNCLHILIKGYLKKKCKITLNTSLIDKINDLIVVITKNNLKELIYNRVNAVQKFIHLTYQDNYGIDSHLNMEVEDMRNLLSTIRLYLNINDIHNNDIYYLKDMILLNDIERDKEIINPINIILPPNKTFIKNWRYENLKIIYDFMPKDMFNNLLKIKLVLPKEEFKIELLNFINTSRKNWQE